MKVFGTRKTIINEFNAMMRLLGELKNARLEFQAAIEKFVPQNQKKRK
jgi:hypothetical protein